MAEKTVMQEATPEQISEVMRGANINEVVAKGTAPEPEKKVEKPAEVPEVKKDETPEVEVKEETAPTTGAETPEPTPQEFNIEFFNKQFSTEFKDEGGVKEAIEAAQKVAALQKQVDTIPSLQEELDMLRQETDPMKYFASEDDFRVAQFKKGFPDKDPAMVAKLFSTDVSKASDFDILTWMTMLDNPDLEGGESGARELVAATYGIDDPKDLSELDSLTKNKLKVSARAERARVNQMKADITLPEKKDYSSLMEQRKADDEAKKAELTSSWQTISGAVVKDFPDIVINDVDKDGNVTEFFKYAVGKDLGDDIVKPIVEGFIEAGISVDEKSARTLGNAIQREFVYRNMDKIVKQAVKNAVATKEEEVLQEEHNPGAPTDKERPKGANDLTQRILQGMQNDGTGPMRAR